MLADADLATTADLMTGHRAKLLLALMGGRTLSAGELATRAGISPSLTSAHLSKLLAGGLVAVAQDGRRRRYRLAGPQVAEVVEAMLTLAPHRTASTLRESTRGQAIRHARTCYDHLAGAVGVALTDSLANEGIIGPPQHAYPLTEFGQARLEAFGLDIAELRSRRRAFTRPCLDWTERRAHLAGALGAGIAERLLELRWLQHIPGTRGLRVTEAGQQHLRDEFGLNAAVLDPA